MSTSMTASLDLSVLLTGNYPKWIAHGLATTMQLTALAWVLAMAVGTALAVARMGDNRWLRAAVAAFVEYHQNVPILVQIFLWYFGMPTLLPDSVQQQINHRNGEFFFAFVAVGLCMGAYISEDLRAGIRAIPRSQLEASRALGLGYLKAFRLVVLPQAARIALPTIISHTVLLFKNTSLAMTVGVAELTYVTREIESQTFRTTEVYLFTTAAYLGVSLLIIAGGEVLARRYRLGAR